MNQRRRHTILCLVLAVGCAGCYLQFPLDTSPQADIEAAALGTWRCLPFDQGAQSKPANIVVKRGRDRLYSIVFQEDGEEASQVEAHASIVKGQTLINARVVNSEAPSKPWLIARYSLVRPNVMHLELIDETKLEAADTSPESLRRTVEQAANLSDLFGDWCVCVRATE